MKYVIPILLAALLAPGCATLSEAQNSTERAEELASVIYNGLYILEALAESRGATPEQLEILQQVRELVRQYEQGFRTINELNDQAFPLLEKAINAEPAK